MTPAPPDAPLESLVIPLSSLDGAARGIVGGGAQVVVVELGTEALRADPLDTGSLDWLRSPARLSISVLRGPCGTHESQAGLACDLVLMARSATLSLASDEVPAGGVLERLVARVGASTALMLALRSTPIDADTAWQHGLVEVVVPDGQLDGLVSEIVAALGQRPQGWIGETKALLAAAEGAQHEPQGRARLRRWEADAAQRLAASGAPGEDPDD